MSRNLLWVHVTDSKRTIEVRAMRVGYVRVSTPDQSFALQRDALERSGCTKIFEEVASGAKTARPVLAAVLDYLRPGDTLVVWRLDRLGRWLGQLMGLMNTLHEREISFHSLVEAIDTTTPMGQFGYPFNAGQLEEDHNDSRCPESQSPGVSASKA
jgi:DNA invertase Pin-like site-specific DNA recombinase